jgi:hypothetical protein
MDFKTKVTCNYCFWEGTIEDCLGGIDDPFACPKCGCSVHIEDGKTLAEKDKEGCDILKGWKE